MCSTLIAAGVPKVLCLCLFLFSISVCCSPSNSVSVCGGLYGVADNVRADISTLLCLLADSCVLRCFRMSLTGASGNWPMHAGQNHLHAFACLYANELVFGVRSMTRVVGRS
jgi:hypothetical protein